MFEAILYRLSSKRRAKAIRAYNLITKCYDQLSSAKTFKMLCDEQSPFIKRDITISSRIRKLVSIYNKLIGDSWIGHDRKG